jgi:hypothetical protein
MGDELMGTPSPFEVGRATASSLGRGFQESRDTSNIDSILSQAQQSGDPKHLQDAIGQILSRVSPERQPEAIKFLENRMQAIQGQNAAQRGGYDQYAPAGVQTEQVRNRNAMNAFNMIRGGGGSIPAAQGQPRQPSILGNPNQTQAQALDPQGSFSPSAEQPQPQQPMGGSIEDLSDKDLVALQAIPALKAVGEAEQKRRQDLRTREMDFHKESAKYDEDLMAKNKVAKAQIQTINDIEKAVKSGNIKPSSLANVFKGMGKIGDKISEAIINGDQATLQASIPQLLDGWKEVFGVRLSDADLRLLQDKLPSIGKNEQANIAILKIMRKYADMNLLRGKIGADIKKANGGIRPIGYADKIEERFDEMVAPVKIVNPKNGNIIEIPAYQVGDAITAGAKLAPMEQ